MSSGCALMGAEVRGVDVGQRTLKEAINEAMRDWVTNVRSTHYILGTALWRPSVSDDGAGFSTGWSASRRGSRFLAQTGRLPDELIACVGGGSNAIGLFFEFLEEPAVRLVESRRAGAASARVTTRRDLRAGGWAFCRGARPSCCRMPTGRSIRRIRVAPSRLLPRSDPEHAFYRDRGRIDFAYATDDEVLRCVPVCVPASKASIPALESTHALAYAMKRARELDKDQVSS